MLLRGNILGIDDGPKMMVVAVTDMAKEVGENPAYKEEDVSHSKNHQQPVKPFLIS